MKLDSNIYSLKWDSKFKFMNFVSMKPGDTKQFIYESLMIEIWWMKTIDNK